MDAISGHKEGFLIVLKFIIINQKASTMTIKVNGGGNGKQRQKMQEEAQQAFAKREEQLKQMQNGGGNGKVRQK